jgi:hypothetical protein
MVLHFPPLNPCRLVYLQSPLRPPFNGFLIFNPFHFLLLSKIILHIYYSSKTSLLKPSLLAKELESSYIQRTEAPSSFFTFHYKFMSNMPILGLLGLKNECLSFCSAPCRWDTLLPVAQDLVHVSITHLPHGLTITFLGVRAPWAENLLQEGLWIIHRSSLRPNKGFQ